MFTAFVPEIEEFNVMKKRVFTFLLVALAFQLAGSAVEPYGRITPEKGDTFALFLAGKTKGAYHFDGSRPFASWHENARKELIRLLKLEEVLTAPRIALNPRRLWVKNFPEGRIEKIVLASEEQMDMPVYFCVPKGKGPFKFFICLQGHSSGMHNSIGVEKNDENVRKEIEKDRDFALQFLKRGYGVLCIEQRALGERNGDNKLKHGCLRSSMHHLMLGRTLIGMRVFDVDRGIDYLQSRGEVEKGFMGVMGNSGGGTAALYSGAVLPRITHVMPSGCFCTFAGSIIYKRHCNCNYIPDILKFGDMAEIAGLCAPKHLVIVNGEKDHIFPIAPAKSEFKRLKAIYRSAGVPDRCIMAVGREGHRFFAEEAFAALAEISVK